MERDIEMRQTLQEAAKAYQEKEQGLWTGKGMAKDFQAAFIAGAQWQKQQSPWISVKDNLPLERVNVFFLVEWRGIHKEYHAGWYRNGIWESEQQIYCPNSFLGNVTHWIPMPKFNNDK